MRRKRELGVGLRMRKRFLSRARSKNNLPSLSERALFRDSQHPALAAVLAPGSSSPSSSSTNHQ